jgi:hypothetical protein
MNGQLPVIRLLYSFEVYMWFLSPLLQCTSVFYIGMTRASKKRIDNALKYEFQKLYAGRSVYRLVIKNRLTKTFAECLEASLQTCYGELFHLPFLTILIHVLDAEKIPLCVRLDFAALQVVGMDYMELRNAAIAYFRMAVASGSYTQHVVANGML